MKSVSLIFMKVGTPNTAVDPGFPRDGSANSKGGCEKLLFGQFFPKNCIKLNEFGRKGGRP